MKQAFSNMSIKAKIFSGFAAVLTVVQTENKRAVSTER